MHEWLHFFALCLKILTLVALFFCIHGRNPLESKNIPPKYRAFKHWVALTKVLATKREITTPAIDWGNAHIMLKTLTFPLAAPDITFLKDFVQHSFAAFRGLNSGSGSLVFLSGPLDIGPAKKKGFVNFIRSWCPHNQMLFRIWYNFLRVVFAVMVRSKSI